MVSRVDEIAPGLWRWTAPHPDWRPGAQRNSPDDWDPLVGCVLYEGSDAAVFIDPLVRADADRFWSWADGRVAGRPVAVLTTLGPHRRSRDQVVRRYAASVSRAKSKLPAGVEPIVLRGAGEPMVLVARAPDAGAGRPDPRGTRRWSAAR